MYKVTLKRYGYPKWDGHQQLRALISSSVPTMPDDTKAKIAQDNQDFMSTIRSLVSITHVKASPEEAGGGLSWSTEFLVTSDIDANAIKEYYGEYAQQRANVYNPSLVHEVVITTV
jgi:hypothetical protein